MCVCVCDKCVIAHGLCSEKGKDSQDVADDSNAPHVGGVADGFIVDHFWGNKFWSSKQNFQSSGIFCNNRQWKQPTVIIIELVQKNNNRSVHYHQ